MHLYTHICMKTCTHIHTYSHTHICMLAHAHINENVHTHAHTHVHMHTHACVLAQAHMHENMHIYMFTHIYMLTQTQTCTWPYLAPLTHKLSNSRQCFTFFWVWRLCTLVLPTADSFPPAEPFCLEYLPPLAF